MKAHKMRPVGKFKAAIETVTKVQGVNRNFLRCKLTNNKGYVYISHKVQIYRFLNQLDKLNFPYLKREIEDSDKLEELLRRVSAHRLILEFKRRYITHPEDKGILCETVDFIK